MRPAASCRPILSRRPALVALAVAVPLLTPAAARASDPVEALRQGLSFQIGDERNPARKEYREAQLKRHIEALKTPGELRRALALQEWKDVPGAPPGIVAIDQAARKEVGERLIRALGAATARKDIASRLAAANLIGGMGTDIRAVDPTSRRGFASGLAPLLAQLCRDPDPKVRAAAARALGKIFPEPAEAAAKLKAMLSKDKEGPRRAAAEALGSLITTATELQKTGRQQTGVEASGEDVLAAGKEVTVAAGTGLKDQDARVRALCLEAIRRAATALRNQIRDPYHPNQFPPRGAKNLNPREIQQLQEAAQQFADSEEHFRPLLEALHTLGTAFKDALKDKDLIVTQKAAGVLEALAEVRSRLRRLARSIPPAPGQAKKLTGDTLGPVTKAAVPALAARLTDKEVRVRLACLYALEALGQDAERAAPALVTASRDKNAFVRWGAVRALGRMAPKAADEAVGALAGCVEDDSADVRATALVALRHYGAEAAPAAGALAKAVKGGDAGTQLLAIQALAAIGPKAKAAVAALKAALAAREAEVRAAAARTLGVFGRAAAGATEGLVAALDDPDRAVRQRGAVSNRGRREVSRHLRRSRKATLGQTSRVLRVR